MIEDRRDLEPIPEHGNDFIADVNSKHKIMNEMMQQLVNKLNERMIHPEKDYDLFLEELQNIGIFFEDTEKGWYYDSE